MKKHLLQFVFLSLSVGISAQIQNKQTNSPTNVEQFTALIRDNAGLQHLDMTEPASVLQANHPSTYAMQKDNAFQTMLLDSVVTKNGSNVNTIKEIHTRDAGNRDTLIANYAWNTGTMKWDMNMKNQMTHDGNGNITSSTNVTIISGFIFGSLKYVATYDTHNNQTLKTTYSWDILTSSWLVSGKTSSLYNAQNKDTEDSNFKWIANTWQITDKTSYGYDTNGYLIQETKYTENTINHQLVVDTKNVYLNNANGRDTLMTASTWNASTSLWVPNSKTRIMLATNDKLSSIISYDWNTTTSAWDNLFKAVYTFDTNGYNGTYIIYMWDSASSAWVEYSKSEYTNNSNGVISVSTTYTWNKTTSVWNKQSTAMYYYTPGASSEIPSISKENYLIYPVPAVNNLYISGLNTPANISIINISGQLIYESQLLENAVDVSSLRSGIYFINIKTTGKESVSRFIKK